VVLCSSKIYFELLEGREERGVDDIALVCMRTFIETGEVPADAIWRHP
jgi:2-oxoglutarate dehydrogenase complex dehydrogenase (E1) component-like enzyme